MQSQLETEVHSVNKNGLNSLNQVTPGEGSSYSQKKHNLNVSLAVNITPT